MTALPILERELRVAARRRSSFIARWVSALAAVVVGGAWVLLNEAGPMLAALGPVGSSLFQVLGWLTFGTCLSAGVFLTADCISEEKREGTLGLLFLTDLKGLDVVAGKLLATSLQGTYGLIAVLPILAVPMILGGVGVSQFVLTCVVLLTTLLLSLACGLLVSTFVRQSQAAMGGTLALVVTLNLGGLGFDAVTQWLWGASSAPIASLTSPAFLFNLASNGITTPFWVSWAFHSGLSIVFFVWACRRVSNRWGRASESEALISRVTSTPAGAAPIRSPIQELDPVEWLTRPGCREMRLLWLALSLYGAAILAFLVWWLATGISWGKTALDWGESLLAWVVYGWVTSVATRVFVEARRSGLLELMVTTPLTVREMWQGPCRVWLRRLSAPLLAWTSLSLLLALSTIDLQFMVSGLATTAPPPTATTNPAVVPTPSKVVVTTSTSNSAAGPTVTVTRPSADEMALFRWLVPFQAMGGWIVFFTNLVALFVSGLWFGLTTTKHPMAVAKTFVFVLVIPWIGIGFLTMLFTLMGAFSMVSNGSVSVAWMPFVMLAVWNGAQVAKNVVFFLWFRGNLAAQFRERAVEARK
ncbi:MAG: ABC transporter permease subunit [Verrucomicrobiales bacterium]|nr:ABC transporter permease subunit [Verrucomicrobiales bacterium]